LNILLPVKGSKGQFFRKYHFSPVKNVKKCRGRDLNSRTSTGQGPQPCAVGQAWLPLQNKKNLEKCFNL